MRKGPCREAARPLSIGEPRPRERDGPIKLARNFDARIQQSVIALARRTRRPSGQTLLGPLSGLPARAHDVVRRSLVHVGRASGAAETHEDCNCCEDVTHPSQYAPGPWATIQCARISPLSTGSRLAPITETWGRARYQAESVSCRSHTHGCRDRAGARAGLRGTAWLARNPRTRSQ